MSDEQNCGNCTFDGGSMCEWVNYQSSNPWTVVKPARLSAGAFPKRDAGGQADGGFLAVKMLTFSSTVRKSTKNKKLMFIFNPLTLFQQTPACRVPASTGTRPPPANCGSLTSLQEEVSSQYGASAGALPPCSSASTEPPSTSSGSLSRWTWAPTTPVSTSNFTVPPFTASAPLRTWPLITSSCCTATRTRSTRHRPLPPGHSIVGF